MSTRRSRTRTDVINPTSLDARNALLEAQRSRARVELQPATAESSARLVTMIEQVLADAFLVPRPMVGGAVRPLGRYEHYRMHLESPAGRLTGWTQALGRAKIATGHGDALLGYRMALPQSLTVVEARGPLHALCGRDLAREVQIYVLGRRGPILGVLEDLTALGARVNCRNAGNYLRRGQAAIFKLSLPAPIGNLDEAVHVVDIEAAPTPGRHRVQVTFQRKNELIADALRADRAARKRRTA